jgi:hypothetical protein
MREREEKEEEKEEVEQGEDRRPGEDGAGLLDRSGCSAC